VGTNRLQHETLYFLPWKENGNAIENLKRMQCYREQLPKMALALNTNRLIKHVNIAEKLHLPEKASPH